MIKPDLSKLITQLTHDLSSYESLQDLFHQHQAGNPLPSYRAIREIVEISRSIIFPGYFGNSKVNNHNVRFYIGVSMERLFDLLSEQIMAALCFDSADDVKHTRRTYSKEQMEKGAISFEESLAQYKSDARRRMVLEACMYDENLGFQDKDIKAILDSTTLSELFAMSEHGQKLQALVEAAAEKKKRDEQNKHKLCAEAAKKDSLAKSGEKDSESFASSFDNIDVQIEKSRSKKSHRQGKQCVTCDDNMKDHALALATEYIASLIKIREMLSLDVKAAFDSDPAATSFGEVICCYPGVRAISNYRMAHQLLSLGVPLIPRAITELAHSETGIDIHPGATIGKSFSIDHGTGVVIGETCIIGNNVKLYQGVTLGAKSIPTDENGAVLSIERHPILQDNVVVYSNATILGRITIGEGAIIGGNVWVTEDVRPHSKVLQHRVHN